MKKQILISVFIILILTACNLPSANEPEVDIVGTQVSRMLTEVKSQTVSAPTNTLSAPNLENTTAPEASPTPEFTATSTSTATNTPTATQDLSDPAVSLGAPAWTDDFNNVTAKWEYSDTWSSFHVANGFLNIISKETPYWHSWYVTSPKIKNFYLEMSYDMPVCGGTDTVGLAFRAPDLNQYYFMGITCNGSWGFYRWTSSGDIVTIIPFTQSNEFKPVTEINRVGVKANGSSYEFYINGKKVGSANDSSLTDIGSIGFVTAFKQVKGFTTRVDKLQYWNLP